MRDRDGRLLASLNLECEEHLALVSRRMADASNRSGADLTLLSRLDDALRAADTILQGAAGLSSQLQNS